MLERDGPMRFQLLPDGEGDGLAGMRAPLVVALECDHVLGHAREPVDEIGTVVEVPERQKGVAERANRGLEVTLAEFDPR